MYRIFGQTVVFYPTDSLVDFYTSYDVMTLIDTFKVYLPDLLTSLMRQTIVSKILFVILVKLEFPESLLEHEWEAYSLYLSH